ncbi:DUF2178 domain-containing protein [Oceanobacillus luteolus]|uniref:DUF2178 domain-containing protein n=1 Tax=Oceanobacillus luteolus TaxID=1274358 RepID=UPI00203E96D5|nr:DUF2178 domain-containing protein [Oceanobacillus luteolus]MCM3740306.1 DUF2178 domain-containing protein [Oceanobacillus luteolus]
MSSRKIGGIIIATAALIVIGYSIVKIINGGDFGFNEITTISILLAMFFSAITWGDKEENDGVFVGDELGQKITEKSSKISYYILLVVLLIAVDADQIVNETNNIFLLAALGLGMIILPLVEFLVAKKYQ